VDADDVGSFEELGEGGKITGETGVSTCMMQHVHVERRGAVSHSAGDSSESDQAERCPMDVTSQMSPKTPAVPATVSQEALSVGCGAGCCQNQEKSQVGRGVVEHAWCVAYDDPSRMSQIHVDIVVTDSCIRHDSKSSGLACGQNDIVDSVGEMGDDPVTFMCQLGESARVRRDVRLDDLVSSQEQRIGSAIDQRTRNQNRSHLDAALRYSMS
jgi:hypothetical protein